MTSPTKGESEREPVGHWSDALQTALERAHRFGDEGDFAGMAEHLRETLAAFPGDPAVLCWLGVAEREIGLDGVAYERFRACLAAEPDDPHVLATAGNAVAAFDDPAAEAALRAAAMLAPDLALARWLYGAYLAREGLVEEGIAELRAALELEPDNPEIHYELGAALALGGSPGEAVDELFRAVELAREDGWVRVVLGLALVEDGRLDEALPELLAGARMRPGDTEAQLVAALAAADQGREDLAWEMLERARQDSTATDRASADEVEERLERGPESARALLVEALAPAAFRDRLAERP